MHKLKGNKSGFSAIELVLIVVVVGLLAGLGFVIYRKHKQHPAATPAVAKTNTSTGASTLNSLPANYQEYKNDTVGFRFGFPKEWGSFKPVNSYDPAKVTVSVATDTYTNAAQNLQGATSFTAYKAASYTLQTEKYGATIKPTSDSSKWVITAVNPVSANKYKVGDTYDMSNFQTVQGGIVYILTTHDEDCTFTRYIAKLKDNYAELSIPSYCSTQTALVSKLTDYNQTVNEIFKSMTIY